MGSLKRTRNAGAYYAGIRLTITQPEGGREAFVGVSTKRRLAGWDEWGLIAPPFRVLVPDLNSRDDVTVALMLAVQALIQAERVRE